MCGNVIVCVAAQDWALFAPNAAARPAAGPAIRPQRARLVPHIILLRITAVTVLRNHAVA